MPALRLFIIRRFRGPTAALTGTNAVIYIHATEGKGAGEGVM